MGIRKLAENSYQIDFYYVDPNTGARRRKRETMPTRTQAARLERQRRTEVANGQYFIQKRRDILFRDFECIYWQRHGRHLKGKGNRAIQKELLAAFGDHLMSMILPGLLQDYLNAKRDATSGRTANIHIHRLGSMFTLAKKWKEFDGENPVPSVDLAEEAPGREPALTKEEIERLYAACSDRIYPLVMCATHTGLRKGDTRNLDWSQVDLERGFIILEVGKTKVRDVIPITPQFREVLQDLGPQPQGRVFGVPEITLKRHWDKAILKAKLPGLQFRDLRHVFATKFAETTRDPACLQKILSHTTNRMTTRYMHLTTPHLTENMAIFAAGMPGGRRKPEKAPEQAPEDAGALRAGRTAERAG
ncbi:tyrosine-type recombinase/integrase [Elusimicrobiota bacterium]